MAVVGEEEGKLQTTPRISPPQSSIWSSGEALVQHIIVRTHRNPSSNVLVKRWMNSAKRQLPSEP